MEYSISYVDKTQFSFLLNIKVNDKYLELFDDPEVKVIANNKPVLVYEKGELVGLIVPIKEYQYD